MVEKRNVAIASGAAKIGRVVAAFVLTLGSAIAAFGQSASPTSGAIRLAFPPGSTRIVVSGTVSVNGKDRYEVDISAGQPLMLHLDSAPGAVALGVTDASTKRGLTGTGQGTPDFQALIPRSGAYYVDVAAIRTQANGMSFNGGYVLSVEVPAPVRFGPGGVAAVRRGQTPGGLPVDYLLDAHAGQTLLLDLASPGGETSLSVSDLVDRHTLIESKPSRHGQVAVRILESASYVISVGPANGGTIAYALDIVVPAVSFPDNLIYAGFPAVGRIVVVAEGASPGGGNAKSVFNSYDHGATWNQMKIVHAPVIPDAVESQSALAACLSNHLVTVDPARIGESRMFNDKPIRSWIKQAQDALSMPVSAFDTYVSPDGQKLAITFLTCHDSQSASMPISTIFAVMDAYGNTAWLADENGTAYFDGYTTSNTANIYDLDGWLSNSQTILVNAPGFDPGAGGSCEPTPWLSLNLNGQPGARFQTVDQVFAANGNSDFFYVGPAPCYDDPREIHRVETATGKDTIVYTGPEQSILILDGVSPRAGGKTELHYHLRGGAAQTLRVP